MRFLDIFVSLTILICVMPILIVICLTLLITGENKVFFFQDRVGKGGKTFNLIKFVTMKKDSPNLLTGTVTVKNDPRVLPFGKFLRATKLNEFPQLFNVLKGDMSLIGPRPQTLECFSAFPPDSAEIIKTVRPGISGIGSIVFRNEDTIALENIPYVVVYNEHIMPYKGRLEEWYVKNRSLGLNIVLLLATLWVVIFSKSAHLSLFLKDLPAPPPTLYKKTMF